LKPALLSISGRTESGMNTPGMIAVTGLACAKAGVIPPAAAAPSAPAPIRSERRSISPMSFREVTDVFIKLSIG